MKFGAEKPDAFRARFGELRQVDEQAGIHLQIDPDTVAGHTRLVAQARIALPAPRAKVDAVGVGFRDIGHRPQMHLTILAVDDGHVAVFGHGDRARHLADDGNAERAGDDHHMAGRRTLFEHEAAQTLAPIVEQLGRAHIARNDDGIVDLVDRAIDASDQLAKQPVGEIVEIMHPLADVRVGQMHHARAHVRLNLLDRRLGRQPVAHRLFQAPHPAAIMGEHPIGFEHRPMLAFGRDVPTREHVLDRQAELGQGIVQPKDLVLRMFVEEVGDDDTRLVQHDAAKADSVGQRHALEAHRAREIERDARSLQPFEATSRDHLGNDHGDRFERLGFLLAILPRGLVLNDQDAQRPPGPQDRHAEKGLVDFLSGLGEIGESRMVLRL